MTEELLKPCPFCGSELVFLDEPITPDSYAVFCNGECGAVGPEDEDGNTAIELWNLRPIEDTLRARVEELEAELAALNKEIDPYAAERLDAEEFKE